MKYNCLLLLLLIIPLISNADICKETKLINVDIYKEEIGIRKVTFMAMHLKDNRCWVINQPGLNKRHPPYSTFKIPHTLIALETKAVKSVDERIEWNQEKHPANAWWPETWKQSQTLASAFKHSAVWYYKELVQRIEPKQYKKWLARFSYGNQTFIPGSDNFWLDGELGISPEEHIEFLTCFVKTRCGVKASTLAAFESVALQEIEDNFLLYAKTGAGPVDPNNFDGAFEGWFVGYVRGKGGRPVAVFAIFVETESFSDLKTFRQDFSLKLLTDLTLWAE